jgi:hypothetical protein
MTDQRELFRINIHRKGFLRQRGETTVCEIHDLTDKGLQLVMDTPLQVGETVALEFQLVDRQIIHCALLVTHVQDLRVGGRIIQISTEHQTALTAFAGQMISEHLVGMGPPPE